MVIEPSRVTGPTPALGLVGLLSGDADLAERAIASLGRVVGPIRRVGPEIPFTWSDYYRDEMGEPLWRSFYALDRLVPRDLLADLKRLAQGIERRFAAPDGSRRVNLDPGLLSLENLVLASTKNQPQRIYLRDGIFAEVTLWYVKGGYRTMARTYPDYGSDACRSLFARIRQDYKQLLRQNAECIDPQALASALEEESR